MRSVLENVHASSGNFLYLVGLHLLFHIFGSRQQQEALIILNFAVMEEMLEESTGLPVLWCDGRDAGGEYWPTCTLV